MTNLIIDDEQWHSNGECTIAASYNGEIHRDVIRVQRAEDRQRYIAAITAKWPAASRLADRLERELTALKPRTTPAMASWPEPMAKQAYHGPMGDWVRTIEPHTEADPAAILVQTLVAFGNVIGHTAHFCAEADRHYGNLFTCLVGETAKGRKGTSWGQVERLFDAIDGAWREERIVDGLASGEGLIWHVRDATDKEDGIDDKRLLVKESEFASVLKTANRKQNTLSPVMRCAWDTGNLRTLAKNSPAVATDAHISIIGHITRDELLRHISETEMANGLANRFLWVCVRRSKCLPDGGSLQPAQLQTHIDTFARAVEHASAAGELGRDAKAKTVWHAVYGDLSEGKPGLVGAVIGRAEAQVMRLAMLYALLDRAAAIGAEHLLAALAIWTYCEESARYIFGDALGDPTADAIWAALRQKPEGMSRTDISAIFGRHKQAAEIERALRVLSDAGLARVDRQQSEGRPAELWVANAK